MGKSVKVDKMSYQKSLILKERLISVILKRLLVLHRMLVLLSLEIGLCYLLAVCVLEPKFA